AGVGGRALIGGNGFGGIFASGENANGSAEVRSAMGFFNVGAVAVAHNRFLLVPYLGVGGGNNSVRIRNQNPAFPVYFDQNTAVGYERVRRYKNRGFALEAGVHFQFFIVSDDYEDEREVEGLALGLEAGGLFRVPGRWRDADDNFIRGPERLGFQGLYVRLTVGGGSYELKRRKKSSDSTEPPVEN
ncbi:MAG: hypothetical protein NZ534_11660, partial [Bacteroidia bacterium]|nr:hypothetical protein [Bacteroidia bacterium]